MIPCQRCNKLLKHDDTNTEVVYCYRCGGKYCFECWGIQRAEEDTKK